jgi:hypothetical protein
LHGLAENYHVAQAYNLLMKPENDILSSLTRQQWDDCRKIIVEMVLATDLAKHFDFLCTHSVALSRAPSLTLLCLFVSSSAIHFGAAVQPNRSVCSLGLGSAERSLAHSIARLPACPPVLCADRSQAKSRLMLLKMGLKCADVGHAAKHLELHKAWSLRIIEEFYRQVCAVMLRFQRRSSAPGLFCQPGA